ncbi:ABC transporter permease [Pengzhenrongella phosphoraccumulans]|uniref:ABC transporter permease n=1 Tax=Pengzhenrongella phosphoraccumulans TaxID=3114394 RepID=UPI00388D24AF
MTIQPAAAGAPPQEHDPAEEFLDRQTFGGRIQNTLHKYPALSPALVLVVAIVVFGFLNDRFIRPENLSLITQQVAVVGALAVGQTLIILTAGIDLSVGAIMVLSSMVMAQTAATNGVPGPIALALGLAVGLLAGMVNGLLVTRLKLPPFIVTLGTLNIFLALTLLYSKGATVRGAELPAILTWTGTTFSLGQVRITIGVLLMILLYAVIAFALGQTAWGRHVYAVGDDQDAARLAGIAVSRVLLSVYVVAGSTFAVAGWILIGRINAASPNAGAEANLDSITAVVIGGTSLFGGRGAVWGSLLGALIVGVFRNGLSLAGLDVLYQTLAVGVLVIVAVSLDQWIRRGHA